MNSSISPPRHHFSSFYLLFCSSPALFFAPSEGEQPHVHACGERRWALAQHGAKKKKKAITEGKLDSRKHFESRESFKIVGIKEEGKWEENIFQFLPFQSFKLT